MAGTGAGLELLVLPLDEAVEGELKSESCSSINCLGCQLTSAQMLDT
jgi:hypothetical protein